MILTSFLRKSLESYPFFWDSLSYWMNYFILTLISYKNRRWDSMRRFLFHSINDMRLTFFLLCRTLEWCNEDLWWCSCSSKRNENDIRFWQSSFIYIYIYINMIFTSFLCKILESYVSFLKNSLSHWMSYIILTLISYKNRIWSSNVLFQELRITSIRVNFNISVDSIFSAKSLLSAIRGLNKKNIICTFLFLMNLFT